MGREDFEIRTSTVWQACGLRQWGVWREGYCFRIDPETAQPIGTTLRWQAEGMERKIEGALEEGYFRFRSSGVGPPMEREVPYAPGTALDGGSPLFWTLVLSLLQDRWRSNEPVSVRTIWVDGPLQPPQVVVSRFVPAGQQGQGEDLLYKIALHRGEAPPIALWVDNRGLPRRVRMQASSGERWEWRWVPVVRKQN